MALLELRDVTLAAGRGRRRVREQFVLCEARLAVHPGESVVVWGTLRSGRTTLLRVAAGVLRPSEGVVTFAGVDLGRRPMLGVTGGIAHAMTRFHQPIAESVHEHVAAPLMGGRCRKELALARALAALERVGARTCAELHPAELDHAEVVRVGIARAIVTSPSLLLLDEPADALPPARSRDALLELIRSLAHDDEIGILATTGDAASLAGVDRAYTLDGGRLRGSPDSSPEAVIPLRAVASSVRSPQADGPSPETRRR